MKDEKNDNPRMVVQQFVAAFNAGDLNRVDDLAAKDLIYHLPPGGETMKGREAFKEFLAGSRQGFPD